MARLVLCLEEDGLDGLDHQRRMRRQPRVDAAVDGVLGGLDHHPDDHGREHGGVGGRDLAVHHRLFQHPLDHRHRVAPVLAVVGQEAVQGEHVEGEQRPVLVGHLAIGGDNGGGLGPDVAGVGGGLLDQARQALVHAHEQADGQFVLAAVMAIDGALGNAGRGRDLLGGRRVDPAGDEKTDGGLVDAILGGGGGHGLASPDASIAQPGAICK